jgi:hypothetical protein
MFRKLYWVTEQVQADGTSQVTGVFTSIPNLVKEGFACNELGSLRLTLTKLDCEDGALGRWTAPNFAGLDERLGEFVKTEEFSAEQCESLVAALANHKAAV